MSKKAPFVAGNWKMHTTARRDAGPRSPRSSAAAPGLGAPRIVVIPPFTALSARPRGCLAGTAVGLGAQNLSLGGQGRLHGRDLRPDARPTPAAAMSSSAIPSGASIFGETDATVNKRIRAALRAGLPPDRLRRRNPRGAGRRADHGQDRGPARRRAGRRSAADDRREDRPRLRARLGHRDGPDGRPRPRPRRSTPFIREKIEERYGKATAACAIILYGGSVKAGQCVFPVPGKGHRRVSRRWRVARSGIVHPDREGSPQSV